MNKLLVPWVEQNGSIFTRDTTRVKLEKGSLLVQLAIAFNVGAATALDIESLGEEVRRRVRETSGVELEWEIKRVGRGA